MNNYRSQLIKLYGEHQISILITGPTGSGKSYMAKKIHLKAREGKPFLTVNLAAVPEGLVESEIFGHARGSFSGAINTFEGRLAQVREGSIFFDEISEISLELQAKLLCFLDTFEYYSLGDKKKKRFHGGLFFASNKNLLELVRKGQFREDLYYRISSFTLSLKGIREDKNRFLKVCQAIYREAEQRFGTAENFKLSSSVLDFLFHKEWRGNFRELKNYIETSVALNIPAGEDNGRTDEAGPTYKDALEKFEKSFLISELEKRNWKINQTAKELEISKVTLIAKSKKYGIRCRDRKVFDTAQPASFM